MLGKPIMENIEIRRYSVSDVFAGRSIRFDTSNMKNTLYEIRQNNKRPFKTSNWINKFNKSYILLRLDKTDIKLLNTITESGYISGRVSDIFKDEVEMLVSKYKTQVPAGRWFVKTDISSLKTGCHGAGPFNNFEEIVEGMTTCLPHHRCFLPDDNYVNLYILPWLNIERDREFRGFVYNNNLTAISSQYIYEINDWISLSGPNEIALQLIIFFNQNIKDRMKDIANNYVFDIGITDEMEFVFFEPGCFGPGNEASSKLFNWITDWGTLTSSDSVEFRFSNRE